MTVACESDARTVDIAVAAFEAENPTAYQSYGSAQWRAALVSRQFGGPFLQEWPSSGYYEILVAGAGPAPDSGDGVVPTPGDVLVVVAGKSYDATLSTTAGCGQL